MNSLALPCAHSGSTTSPRTVPSCRSPRCNWTKRDEEGFNQSKQGEEDWSRDELTCKINILERKKRRNSRNSRNTISLDVLDVLGVLHVLDVLDVLERKQQEWSKTPRYLIGVAQDSGHVKQFWNQFFQIRRIVHHSVPRFFKGMKHSFRLVQGPRLQIHLV